MRTIYGVQAFRYVGDALSLGVSDRFMRREEAERVAERLYANHAGVQLYAVTGDAEADIWQPPRALRSWGRVLDLEAA